ncbi:unnamed protein product, partial [Ectocarpus sp. 12 AP-2014]
GLPAASSDRGGAGCLDVHVGPIRCTYIASHGCHQSLM